MTSYESRTTNLMQNSAASTFAPARQAAMDEVAPAGPRLGTRRLAREWKTLTIMVRCYCMAHHHSPSGPCRECQGLLDYAALRLQRCGFGDEKPTCAKCPVHCYQEARREQVRAVMRYAGPRMLWRHPILCLWHWIG